MTPSDPARHALYAQLERVLGSEHADTLMAYLPQHPSDEAATKADVQAEFARLEEKMDLRFAATERRLDRIEDRFDRLEDQIQGIGERMERMQRFYVGTTVWSMTALTAIFSLVVTFFR